MLFRQLLLAASAAAILIVPETSDNDDGIFRALPVDVESFEIPVTAFAQTIDLPCSQCRGHDTHLKMEFTVEDETRLMLNGFELYPNADPWQGDLSAAVVKGSGKSRDRRLGYGLAVRPEGMDEGQHLEVIAVELLVLEVGDRFVEGIPLVKVKLVKAPKGDILIGSIDVVASQSNDDAAQCTSMWCRVPSMIDHAWKSVKGSFKSKGCGGMRHGHKAQHDQDRTEEETGFTQEGHKHGHSEHKSHRHHSLNVLKHITSYIFLPVLMGITAGVGVAMYVISISHPSFTLMLTKPSLAMFLGTLAIRVMRLIRGERQEAPAFSSGNRKMDIVEFIAADEEKAGLMAHQDDTPEYQDEETRN
ncbi:hypothetical protein AK830_g7778 [Neonectria ditissima]|uniref:DUF7728 domain-containing protein n=1 Tax=Neonectria ditissima TaxID=78410 RepID=A0A0P7B9C9_9HYPO|nr:hypothetical protein AK830_g7778 [Neonectria ditissima]